MKALLIGDLTDRPGEKHDHDLVYSEYEDHTDPQLGGTYIEIDKAPRKSEENIKTQKDISATLDKLNTSFDNLLKQIETHEKWNVNAEIRVLNSMIEMEGFADEPISKPSLRKGDSNKELTQ